MCAQQNLPEVPYDIKFRVLVIGRANAGKTSILRRVCGTTENPEVYRPGPWGERKRVQLELEGSVERGEHDIENELTFSSHRGYIFHDSCGFEAGSDEELKIVQEFVRRKSQERQLKMRLHAIWYCIPMDNDRPLLDLKYFDYICPDKNVPVIAVFTKYDQFRRDIRITLEDKNRNPVHLKEEIERMFCERYLAYLSTSRGSPPYVRLERMDNHSQRCTDLIEITAKTLSGGAAALIFLAVQKDSLELSIKQAVKWIHDGSTWDTNKVIKACIVAFPSLWVGCNIVF